MSSEFLSKIAESDIENMEGDTYEFNEDKSILINKRTEAILQTLSIDVVEDDLAGMERIKPISHSTEEIKQFAVEVIDLMIKKNILPYNIQLDIDTGKEKTNAISVESKPLIEKINIKLHVLSDQDMARLYRDFGALEGMFPEYLLAKFDDAQTSEKVSGVIDDITKETGGVIFLPKMASFEYIEDTQSDVDKGKKVAKLNMSERELIVIAETKATFEDFKTAKDDTNITSCSEEELLNFEQVLLKVRMCHEILHALRIGSLFPEHLREGIVEKYTLEVLDVGLEYPGIAKLFYPENMKNIQALETSLVSNANFTDDAVRSLFIESDQNEYANMFEFYSNALGSDKAYIIFKQDQIPSYLYKLLKQ